jgi:periplasmic divalent cation tolerance protein
MRHPGPGEAIMAEYVQVQVAVGSRDEGLRIARASVDAQLAASAQLLGPMTSTYRWRGAVRVADEYQLLLNTTGVRYSDLEKLIRQLHSYEVAEIISVTVSAGQASYLAWIDEETQAPAE